MRAELALSQLFVRGLIFVTALVALGFARVAGEPFYAIEIAVLALAVLCAFHPDSHVGLLVVLGVGVNWVAGVDAAASPWAIGVAVSLAMFHASVSAASIAPLGAAWTPALGRRWSARVAVIALLAGPTWLIVHVLEQRSFAPNSAVFIGALVALTLTALWLGPNVVRIRYLRQRRTTGV